MSMLKVRYKKVRSELRPGDVIGFNGRGPVSWLIRKGAGIPTHLALVVTPLDSTHQQRVQLIESTSLSLPGKKRFIGVQRTYLSDRLMTYKGEIWWFPLSKWAKALINGCVMEDVLDRYEGVKYDFWQAFREGWSKVLPRLFPVSESANHVYCSELVAFVFKELGILPEKLNPSCISPAELVSLGIFSGTYYQLKGKSKQIPRYNTLGIVREDEHDI